MSEQINAIASNALMVHEAAGSYRTADDGEVLRHAELVLMKQLRAAEALDDVDVVKRYLRVHLGTLQYEVFTVLYLDCMHRFIASEELFRGTLSQTSVYPREVVRQCMKHNAAAVIFAHNHPSGNITPSRADEQLTQVLKQALQLIDVRVLDHLVVAALEVLSMAERGLV